MKNSFTLSKKWFENGFITFFENGDTYFYARKKVLFNRKSVNLIKVSQGIHKAVKNDYNVNVSDLFIGS